MTDFYKLAQQLHAAVMKLDVYGLRHRARWIDIANANGLTMREFDEIARLANYSHMRLDALGYKVKYKVTG